MTTTSLNIKVVKKYKGIIRTDKYFNDNPKILALLPSKGRFATAYRLLKIKANGRKAILEMSENGIKTFIVK